MTPEKNDRSLRIRLGHRRKTIVPSGDTLKPAEKSTYIRAKSKNSDRCVNVDNFVDFVEKCVKTERDRAEKTFETHGINP